MIHLKSVVALGVNEGTLANSTENMNYMNESCGRMIKAHILLQQQQQQHQQTRPVKVPHSCR